jgi:hypothetical protein
MSRVAAGAFELSYCLAWLAIVMAVTANRFQISKAVNVKAVLRNLHI